MLKLILPQTAAAASPAGSLSRRARRSFSSSPAVVGRLDAAAVVLLRCADAGWSFWAWADGDWAGLLCRDQDGFREAVPA